MENTNIEWAINTFNPWGGCEKVSPGCKHCYAETLVDKRFHWAKWGKGQERRRTSTDYWKQPARWDRAARGAAERPRVFCASLSDWLDHEVPHEWRIDLLNLIAETPNLDWLLLTKRPQSWRARVRECRHASPLAERWLKGEAPANVWVGTSAEDQKHWDLRMPKLMAIPGRVHFVSAEPLLGPIVMGELRPDWLIVGGESGPSARPMEREWVTALRDQCDHRTAFHFKQWGGVRKKATGRELDGRTWDEFPRL
jgi:protein gp37